MKYFIVYKTTHLPTNKFYIGRHVTTKLDDNYYGSGILFHSFTYEEMKLVEAEFIVESYDHPDCINVGTFVDSLPVMSDEGRKALSEFRKTVRMKNELKLQISSKLKGRKKTAKESESQFLSWTLDRKLIRSQKYTGAGNPRAKEWTVKFEDGREVKVKSLKTWCREHNIKYTSLLASQTTQSFYHGMKLYG